MRWRRFEIRCSAGAKSRATNKIKAVGEALHVNQRVPFGFFQLFILEDFVIDVFLQNAKIDVLRTG
jgi:hypothetical protein